MNDLKFRMFLEETPINMFPQYPDYMRLAGKIHSLDSVVFRFFLANEDSIFQNI